MPRFSTAVAVATTLVVVFNLIPSSRYTRWIQQQYKKQENDVVGVPVAELSMLGNTTTTWHPPSPLKFSSVNTTTWHPSTINRTTELPTRHIPKETFSTNRTAASTIRLSFPTPMTTNLSQFLKETQQHLIESATATAWSNVSTYSFGPRHLISGYRNQIMSLTMLMMKANEDGHEQFLLDSIQHKDTYGTNQFVPFEVYFDVEHWNSFYNATEYHRANQTSRHPVSLPRLVYHDPKLHHQWDSTTNTFIEAVWNSSQTPTHPYGYLKPSTRLQMTYQRYASGKTKYVQQQQQQQQDQGRQPFHRQYILEQSKRNPAEILMLQGALKPHPTLQGILESLLTQMKHRATNNNDNLPTSTKNVDIDWSYMTLHARVEPDMQRHPVCKDKKVLHLRNIIQMIETKFPHPPVSIVFMPINRQYLEREGILPVDYHNNDSRNNTINWVAVDNLRELNRISQDGMWNGTVPVMEFGANALKGTVYEHRPSTAGAILNFFLTLQPQCTIFVGTPVSSFSHDVLASRFYRGYSNNNNRHYNGTSRSTAISTTEYQNYQYLPDGLVDWISSDMVDSPGFIC